MMRSLYSGVAGLKTHQTKMDVIGNNIANVNTIGFKSSSVLFRDVLYQTTASATGATATTGGTNASQIGLGTKVSSISTAIGDTGASQSTNNPYDLMLDGSSMFIVSRGNGNYFTKVGNFQVDAAGCLVTSNGYQVMGWQVDPEDPTQIKKDTVSALYPESEANKVSDPEMTSAAYMKGNVDFTDPELKDGKVVSVSIYDNLGYPYTVKFELKKDAAVTDNSIYDLKIVSITTDDPDANATTSTSKLKDILADGSYNATIGGADSIKIKFDPNTGSFTTVGDVDNTKTALLEITPTDGTDGVFKNDEKGFEGITIDFSNLTMFESDGNATAKMVRGATDATGGGRSMGKLTDVSIDTAGKIYGVYTNGETKLLGQIAVAKFSNVMGLESVGNSMYAATQNSGDFDGIGSSVDEDGGTMSQGVLEMSNVDLSAEFTDMITTQRGFQANSRIITTSDSMLEELVNLKR